MGGGFLVRGGKKAQRRIAWKHVAERTKLVVVAARHGLSLRFLIPYGKDPVVGNASALSIHLPPGRPTHTFVRMVLHAAGYQLDRVPPSQIAVGSGRPTGPLPLRNSAHAGQPHVRVDSGQVGVVWMQQTSESDVEGHFLYHCAEAHHGLDAEGMADFARFLAHAYGWELEEVEEEVA